jgi:hypothetical protein
MRWIASVLWHWLIGAAMTLTPMTAVIAMGWVQRRMAAGVVRHWGQEPHPSPNWFGLGARRFGGLAANAVAGFSAALALIVCLSPIWTLWIVAWRFGWENSFLKGYEQAWIGPVLGLTGVALFSLLMTLLPLAEARFAVTRDRRAFTDIRMLWSIARSKPFWTFALALVFLAGGVAAAALKALPLGIGNTLVTAEQAAGFVAVYPIVCAAILFPLYVGTRLAAARLYAQAIRYPASEGMLACMIAQERDAVVCPPPRRIWATAPFRFVWSGGLLAATLASWAAFAFVLYTAQFLAHDWAAWINHPLIQVPTVMSIFRAP